MARLPEIGGDDNQWGIILNDFLSVTLGQDGTLNDSVVTNAKLDATTQTTLSSVASKYTKPPTGIPLVDLSTTVQDSLGKADTALQSVTKNDIGLGSVDNTSDANKPVSTATQAALDAKSDLTHDHDDRYYTETETDTLLNNKQDAGDYATITESHSRFKSVRPARLDRLPYDRYWVGVDPTLSRYLSVSASGIFQAETPSAFASVSIKGWPAGVGFTQAGRLSFVYFKSYWYMQAKQWGSGTPAIYRAADVANPGTFSWSAALATAASDIITTGLSADDQYIYWAEYGQPSGGPRLRRSSDGVTWSVVYGPIAGQNHFHAVEPDPFVPGHVYATIGDTATLRHIRSTDYGATWSTLSDFGNISTASYQAVQISFSESSVWFACDGNLNSFTALRMDRATEQISWASPIWHHQIAVPGGVGGRRIDDLSVTSGSTSASSATANFTQADVGSAIRAANSNISSNTYIATVASSTSITFTTAPTATATTSALISGDLFYGAAFYGAVDPQTDIYYCVANDTSSKVGNTAGLFAIFPNGTMTLIRTLPRGIDSRMYIDAVTRTGFCGEYLFSLLDR